MKTSLKSPEPKSLTDYRQAKPESTWDQMRNDALNGGQLAYQEIKRQVVRDQRCLCAYCERRIANGTTDDEIDARKSEQTVEHFHPKSDCSGRINWTLHWPNLWGVCDGGSRMPPAGEPLDPDKFLPPLPENLSCDQFKDRQIEIGELKPSPEGWILAPDEVPSFPRLFKYHSNGEIAVDVDRCDAWSPSQNQHTDNRTLAAETIRHLNLNCLRLKRLRNIAWGQLEKAIKRERELSPGAKPYDVLLRLARRSFPTDAWRPWTQFFSLIRFRLGEVAEKHLESIDYNG
ncbi:MAG: TIGR02646 family protein [Planctomycetota bacterium]|nr:TIGR02646 family protein [Planctomycetota bacterium]